MYLKFKNTPTKMFNSNESVNRDKFFKASNSTVSRVDELTSHILFMIYTVILGRNIKFHCSLIDNGFPQWFKLDRIVTDIDLSNIQPRFVIGAVTDVENIIVAIIYLRIIVEKVVINDLRVFEELCHFQWLDDTCYVECFVVDSEAIG